MTDHMSGDESTHLVGRPLIVSKVFSGEKDFGEWILHLESVAVVNKWDEITKFQQLHM